MNAVFLGGSRAIRRLSPDVCRRIDEFVEQHLSILVGDADGADKAIQRYLASRQHRNVTVFCSGEQCRNNVANWPARRITLRRRSKDFEFFAAKDREMAREATVALMIWDGRSLGTALNVVRMLKQGKRVELFETPGKQHWILWNDQDWLGLLRGRDTRLADRVNQRLSQEPANAPTAEQAQLPFVDQRESRARDGNP